jgi:polyphosphate glucokinase
MNVLVIDVGGSHVKCLLSGETEPRVFDSGPDMTPGAMVEGVREVTGGLSWDAVSIGYPGPVRENRPVGEPHNLAKGWVDFDFEGALGAPVRIINDAAMQALGSYRGGRMLFLGLGTGLGSAMILDNVIQPLELAHLPYRKGRTYEEWVGEEAMDRLGKRKWRKVVRNVVEMLSSALLPDYVVLGGGNARKLDELPPDTVAGENANAFQGGFLLWKKA